MRSSLFFSWLGIPLRFRDLSNSRSSTLFSINETRKIPLVRLEEPIARNRTSFLNVEVGMGSMRIRILGLLKPSYHRSECVGTSEGSCKQHRCREQGFFPVLKSDNLKFPRGNSKISVPSPPDMVRHREAPSFPDLLGN